MAQNRPTEMYFDSFTHANGDIDVYRCVPRRPIRQSAAAAAAAAAAAGAVAAGAVARGSPPPRPPPTFDWVHWVCVRHSPGRGKGLFAARAFVRGETIGRYSGFVMGRASNQHVRNAEEALSYTPEGDAIVKVDGVFVDARRPMQSNQEQMQLIQRPWPLMSQPQWKWPGAYVHMANDPRGTRRQANTELTRAGYYEATRNIAAGDELLWTYGDESYWKNANLLGTKKKPIVINSNNNS